MNSTDYYDKLQGLVEQLCYWVGKDLELYDTHSSLLSDRYYEKVIFVTSTSVNDFEWWQSCTIWLCLNTSKFRSILWLWERFCLKFISLFRDQCTDQCPSRWFTVHKTKPIKYYHNRFVSPIHPCHAALLAPNKSLHQTTIVLPHEKVTNIGVTFNLTCRTSSQTCGLKAQMFKLWLTWHKVHAHASFRRLSREKWVQLFSR